MGADDLHREVRPEEAFRKVASGLAGIAALEFVDTYLWATPTSGSRASRWGFFARDPETFIQSLYLANCQDPVSLRERVHDGLAWLSADDRLAKIAQRAEGHGKILEARQLSLD